MEKEKDTIIELLDMLNHILLFQEERKEWIRKFQDKVWDLEDSCPEYEIFLDLAYDLDYYESNPEIRKEDSTYYGDERLLTEINVVINKVQKM